MYSYSYYQEIRCNFAIAVDSFDMKTARKILHLVFKSSVLTIKGFPIFFHLKERREFN